MIHWGPVPAGSVIPFHFPAYGASGESLTFSGFAVTDIEIYKDTSMTQRASDNGYALLDTDGTDIDSMTGAGGFSVDTSDNSTASFYAPGSFYTVWVNSITINSQTVRFIAGTFRLVAAEATAGYPVTTAKVGTGTGEFNLSSGVVPANVTQFGGSNGTFASGRPEVNTTHAAGTAWGSGAITAASIASGAFTSAKFAAGAFDAVWSVATRILTAGTNIGFPSASTIATAVWDALTSALTTSGSIGKLLVDNINATISSRLASASYTAPPSASDIRSAVGLASANLDTQLAGLDTKIDTIDGNVDDVKGVTESFTFDVAGYASVNIKYVNDVEVIGDGDGTKWGPAP